MTLAGIHDIQDDDHCVGNLKGFAPEEFKFLMNHEKAYIAKRE